MKWIANITGGYSSSARVVDGTLILSLPDAVSPVVWRMDLGHVTASALEVREKGDGIYILTLKTPKGDVSEIAPFADRSRAVRALMAVSTAMENAQGQMRPATSTAANDTQTAAPLPAARKGGNAVAGIVGIIILLGLIAFFVSMGPRPQNIEGASGANAFSPAAGSTGSVTEPGRPVSADDFLRSR